MILLYVICCYDVRDVISKVAGSVVSWSIVSVWGSLYVSVCDYYHDIYVHRVMTPCISLWIPFQSFIAHISSPQASYCPIPWFSLSFCAIWVCNSRLGRIPLRIRSAECPTTTHSRPRSRTWTLPVTSSWSTGPTVGASRSRRTLSGWLLTSRLGLDVR
jgi:hypothetical protein